MRVCGRQYGCTRYPFSLSFVTRTGARSPGVHVHALTDRYVRKGVCESVRVRVRSRVRVWVSVGARTCSPTKRKYVPGFYGRSERRRAVLLLE